MKKIGIFILLLALCVGAEAQTATNRTASTKVSDALALMPAPNHAELTRLMEDFISTGAEGIDLLTSLFESTNNTPVSYALSGWAAYVSDPARDNDTARETFTRGVIRALDKSADNTIKEFYISLLQRCGGDESVPTLSSYIPNKELCSPALVALASIGTPAAKAAIVEAIKQGKGDKVALALAVGNARVSGDAGVEHALILWAGEDVKLNQAVYFALARVGTLTCLPLLRTATQQAGYTTGKDYPTDYYILLINRLATEGYTKEATVEASKLLKKATDLGITNTQIAALSSYISILGEGAASKVEKVLDSPNRAYRNSALALLKPYFNDRVAELLIGKMQKPKTSINVKVDLITFLGLQQATIALPQIMPYITGPNQELAIASMWAATRLGGRGVAAELVTVLKNPTTSPALLAQAKACLLSSKESLLDVVASAVENGADPGRIAALEILAQKGAVSKANEVMTATQHTNPAVSMAAYQALKGVVDQNQLFRLYSLLENASTDQVPLVQAAIVEAIKPFSTAKKLETIKVQMLQNSKKKALYYVPIASVPSPQAMQIIMDGYKNGTANDQEQALQALMSWQGPQVMDALLGIARTANGTIANKVLMGYVSRVAASEVSPQNKQLMLTDALDLATTPAQRTTILREMATTKTFQAMITAGKYLSSRNAELQQQAVQTVHQIALNRKDLYGKVVADLLTRAVAANHHADKQYQEEEINKHIAQMPREGGYVALFNGHDLTGWKGLVEDPIKRAKMKPTELSKKQVLADHFMNRDWSVVDGILTFTGEGYDNICTEKKYGDFELYLDWMLYADGASADAGIYLRGTPQVQMWDTARHNVGAQVGSGGLYNNQVNPSKPSSVADNKLGKWNTFYIKMVGDHVTVVLNGEKVVDNVVLENYWDRSLPIPALEQIELQAHGTRVGYRNLYINELPRPEPFTLSAEEQKEGFKVLFDGTNMHQWQGNTLDYEVEQGSMTLNPSRGNGGNLFTKQEYSDFIFRFEFKLTPGANNGLGIRTPTTGDPAYVGMELQILDNEAPIYSKLETFQYHGSVYGVIAAKRGFLKPTGEWNVQEVVAKGNQIKVTLNGEVILEGDIALESEGGNATRDLKPHPGLLNPSGYIGFLGHGSQVSFRNIRIKEL